MRREQENQKTDFGSEGVDEEHVCDSLTVFFHESWKQVVKLKHQEIVQSGGLKPGADSRGSALEVARRYTKAENCVHMAGEDGLWKARTITRNCFSLMPSSDVSYASKLLAVGRDPTDDLDMNCF